MFQSSNPVLAGAGDVFEEQYGVQSVRSDTASVSGVIHKTGILTGITAVGGVVGYTVVGAFPAIQIISCLAAFVIGLALFFVLRGNPMLAGKVAWIYAIVEGVFLGSLTATLDGWLQGYVAAQGGTSVLGDMSLAVPAFVITMAVMLSVLGLYRAGIVRPTARFNAVMKVLVGAVMLTYLISLPLMLMGIKLPYIHLGSAMQGGTPALIGLGLSVVILVIAGLTLVTDIGLVEDIVESGAPRQMEWYAAFALIVTLTWIYYEAVKLSFRLAILFSNRD